MPEDNKSRPPLKLPQQGGAPPPPLPENITLASHYAYYAEDGLLRSWPAGAVVTDPDEIADLVKRKAPLKE